jgi:hypothetical protein
MKVGIAALNDTQRLVLASGKALAGELGLTEFSHPMQEITIPDSDKAMLKEFGLTESSYLVPSNDITFTEGQTALIASPFGTKVGAIHVEEIYERPKTRHTEYYLNDEVLFQKNQRLIDGEWVAVFSADLNIPVNSTLYVS